MKKNRWYLFPLCAMAVVAAATFIVTLTPSDDACT